MCSSRGALVTLLGRLTEVCRRSFQTSCSFTLNLDQTAVSPSPPSSNTLHCTAQHCNMNDLAYSRIYSRTVNPLLIARVLLFDIMVSLTSACQQGLFQLSTNSRTQSSPVHLDGLTLTLTLSTNVYLPARTLRPLSAFALLSVFWKRSPYMHHIHVTMLTSSICTRTDVPFSCIIPRSPRSRLEKSCLFRYKLTLCTDYGYRLSLNTCARTTSRDTLNFWLFRYQNRSCFVMETWLL